MLDSKTPYDLAGTGVYIDPGKIVRSLQLGRYNFDAGIERTRQRQLHRKPLAGQLGIANRQQVAPAQLQQVIAFGAAVIHSQGVPATAVGIDFGQLHGQFVGQFLPLRPPIKALCCFKETTSTLTNAGNGAASVFDYAKT
jgi:hypothetical protein